MDFSVSHFNNSIFFSNNSLDIRRFVCVSYSVMVLQNGGVNTKIGRMLNLFGRYSLEIYILHRFMTSTCDMEMFGKYIFETGSITIEILVALCLSLLFAYISVYMSRFIRLNKILSIVLLGDKK